MEPNEPTPAPEKAVEQQIERERWEILEQLEDWLEGPVLVLGGIWLVLVILDFTTGLSPFANMLVYFIWGVFIFDFVLRLWTAPRKLAYLRRNWLTALSLFIPALRIGRLARLVRVFRALRGARLISLVGSVNRSMRVLRSTLQQNAFGYVLLLTLIVVLVGAAGIFAFEGPLAPENIGSYGEALYWTSMIITTLGSDYWPRSAEGRLLALLLSTYGLAMFGYVTATIATFFIGKNPERPAIDGMRQDTPELRAEISALRLEVGALHEALRQERSSRDDAGPGAPPPEI